MFALLLLGVCAEMPLFDGTGPVCPIAAQSIECRCTECMEWDAPVESTTGVVNWYDIERTNPDGSFGIVGGTWRTDWLEDDFPMTLPPATHWCFARDSSMPVEGVLYGYRVRACNTVGCSSYDTVVEYRTAPYAIDSFRPPVQGN